MILAPNDADVLAQIGLMLAFVGQWERGVAIVEKANRLNPVAAAGWYHTTLFYDLYLKSQYAESLAAVRGHPLQDLFETINKYVVVYPQLGQVEEAQRHYQRIADIGRAWTLSDYRDIQRVWNFRESDIDKFVEGARKAGVPEDDVLAMPQGPRIAVLPFANLSSDESQEYFSDGMTEEIITELARFRDLFVMARQSTAQYKGRDADVAEIAEDLGVDYVVEGSVRRGGNTVRITAQLIDAATESHVWAETYDRDLTTENLFAIQDDIAAQIAATIGGARGAITLARLGQVRRKPSARLDTYECVLLWFETRDVYTDEIHLRARDCLERTVELDPTYAEGWAALASIYELQVRQGFNATQEYDALQRAIDAAERALKLDPSSQLAHVALALSISRDTNLIDFAPKPNAL